VQFAVLVLMHHLADLFLWRAGDRHQRFPRPARRRARKVGLRPGCIRRSCAVTAAFACGAQRPLSLSAATYFLRPRRALAAFLDAGTSTIRLPLRFAMIVLLSAKNSGFD
jgi:hypothetical protein